MKIRVIALLGFFAFTVTCLSPVRAGEGKIPVWMPTGITQPGHYIVTRDISASAGPVISIMADGVTLDLNGHTIASSDMTQPTIQIGGAPGSERGIIVVGGKVQGGLHGVLYLNPIIGNQPLSLAGLTIAGTTAAAVKGVGFSQLSAKGIIVIDGLVGFDLQASAPGIPPPPVPPTATIRGAGIRGDGGVLCYGVSCSIHDMTFEYAPPSAAPRSPALRFSGVTGAEAAGIIIINTAPSAADPPMVEVLETCWLTLSRTKLVGPAAGSQPCIALDAASRDFIIDDGDVSRCGGDGIRALGTNGRIRGMFISGVAGHGVFAGGSNLIIDDGKIADSDGAGIWFETSNHIYRDNILRGNTGGGVGGPGAADATDAGGNVE